MARHKHHGKQVKKPHHKRSHQHKHKHGHKQHHAHVAPNTHSHHSVAGPLLGALAYAALATGTIGALFYMRYFPTIGSDTLAANPATTGAFGLLSRYFDQTSILSAAHSDHPSCLSLLPRGSVTLTYAITGLMTPKGSSDCADKLDTLSNFVVNQLGPRPPAHEFVVPAALALMTVFACAAISKLGSAYDAHQKNQEHTPTLRR